MLFIAVVSIVVYLRQFATQNAGNKALVPDGQRRMITHEELARNDGTYMDLPIYLAIKGFHDI